MENSFFSKEIMLVMCKYERAQFFSYLLFWIIVVFNRSTPIDLIVAISLALYSEQVLSRYLRMEWSRWHFESVFDSLYELFQTKAEETAFDAMVLHKLVLYENIKANGAVPVSSRIFNRLNPRLSQEWEAIKKTLGLT